MRFNIKVLLVVLVMAHLPLQAAEVTRMFEATRMVASQDKDGRAVAFDQGFREVLVRVSGNSRAAGVNANAQSFVQQYRYLALDKTQPLPAGAPPNAAYTLWMQFDESAVKNLLREQNLPVWGAQRPAVIMWLAVRDGKNRNLLSRNDVSPIKDAVEREAKRRGVPVIWPENDATDKKMLNISDVWGGFYDPVMRASKRYAAEVVITGKIEMQVNAWSGELHLMIEGQAEDWNLQVADMNQLFASSMDFSADRIGSRFAVLLSQSGASSMQVQVSGINTAEGYSKVAHYLQSLALVKHVYVTNVNTGTVMFNLEVNGGEEDLRRVIAIDKTLVNDDAQVTPATTPQPEPVTGVQPVILRYRLNS